MGAGREVLESFGELMHDRVEPVYTEDVLGARSASSRRTLTVTVQTCGDLQDIRPLVEGQPSTEFPLQTPFVSLKREQLRASANHQERGT